MSSLPRSGPVPTLSSEQCAGYLTRIGFTEPISAIKHDLDTLAQLTFCHITHVPFENLTIHRSLEYSLSIQDLYNKICNKRQGGFCFEVNGLFGCLLHSLGFDVRLVETCVNRGHYEDVMRVWIPWTHMVIIVTIGEQHYAVDVGFGAPPLGPILLSPFTEQTLCDGFRYRVVPSRPMSSPISYAPLDYHPVSDASKALVTSTVDQTQDDYLIFERWSVPKQAWIPRIMIHAHLQNRVYPDHFLSPLQCVLHRTSPFRADVLVTLIPRPHVLWTLSGLRLIETVTPYGERVETTLSQEQALHELKNRFGIDLSVDEEHEHPVHFGGMGYEPPPATTTTTTTTTIDPPRAENESSSSSSS